MDGIGKIKLTEYPEVLYEVNEVGQIEKRILNLKKYEEIISTCTKEWKKYHKKYRPFDIQFLVEICVYDNEGNRIWKLKDNPKSSFGYNELNLDYINNLLNGLDRNGNPSEYKAFWTLDYNKAIEISKKYHDEYYPSGKVWKVITYFDDVDEHVYKSGLSYKEAYDLSSELQKKNKNRPYWSCRIKFDKN